MLYTPDISSASIVLVGKFNPAIFTPAWFAKVQAFTDAELATAETQLIHPEITQWHTNQLRLEVQPNRFQATTLTEPFVMLLDVVATVFKSHLPHTPINAFGINVAVHFPLDTAEQRMKLGRALAPTTPWGKFGARLDRSTDPHKPSGMSSLVMIDNSPPDRVSGSVRVQIEPSRKPHELKTVVVGVNDHFDLPDAKDEDGASSAMELLLSKFDSSIFASKSIVSEIMTYAAGLK